MSAEIGADTCVYCFTTVRPRQQALLCDNCEHWQHRKCGQSGIDQKFYWRLVRGEVTLEEWWCVNCTQIRQQEKEQEKEDEYIVSL